MHRFPLLTTCMIFAPLALTQTGPSIPPSFNFSNIPNELLASFQDGKDMVQPGILFGDSITKKAPQIGLQHPIDGANPVPASSANITTASGSLLGTQNYLVIMIDIDAPTPQNQSESQLLHWFKGDLRLVDGTPSSSSMPYALTVNNATDPYNLPYFTPQPGPTSPPHEYLLYLFRQPLGLKIPAEFKPSFVHRIKFDIAAFAKATGLGSPIASTYFYVSQQQSVPGNFVGSPNTTYPNATNTSSATTASSTAAVETSNSGNTLINDAFLLVGIALAAAAMSL